MAYELKPNQVTIFKNDRKQAGESTPDYKGQVNVGGKLMDIYTAIRSVR